MKMIDIPFLFQQNASKQLTREIKNQQLCKHSNIINLYGYFLIKETKKICLILEYSASGSIYDLLKKNGKFQEKQASQYCYQICKGIQYLHQNRIIHRDLKLENMMLSFNQVKIADFGWSTASKKKTRSFCGTLDYVSPEMIKNKQHNNKVDIWAIGVIIFEMVYGKTPFYDKSESLTYCKIIENDYQMIQSFSNNLKDLLQNIFVLDPDDRYDINQILQHKWILENQD